MASVLLNTAALMARPFFRAASVAGALFFALQAFVASSKVKKFDKTQAKFVQQKFVGDEWDAKVFVRINIRFCNDKRKNIHVRQKIYYASRLLIFEPDLCASFLKLICKYMA